MEKDSEIIRHADWETVCLPLAEISGAERLMFYNQHAATYDNDMITYNLRGPTATAKAIHKYLEGNVDARILDIGCGTGLVMTELNKIADYKSVDGLDPSTGMIEMAKDKGIYKNLYTQFFNTGSEFEHNSYDAVMCSGALVPTHMRTESIKEMYAIVKPGGYIVLAVKTIYMETDPDLCQIRPFIKQMCEDGEIELVEDIVFEGYHLELTGTKFVLKKIQ